MPDEPPIDFEDAMTRALEQARREWEREARDRAARDQLARDEERSRARYERYGLTREQFDAMIAAGGRCPCCGTPFADMIDRRPAVDLDFRKGPQAIRGVICERCNLLLAFSGDSSKVLRVCAAYLDRFAQEAPDA
jgi:hypothetical protein